MIREVELEKEIFINYVNSTLNDVANIISIEYDQQNLEGFELKPEDKKKIKPIILELIEKIKNVKDKENDFYNDLLKDLPILEYFSEEIKDLNQLIGFVGKSIISEKHEHNIQQINELISSPDIFYFINKKNNFEKLEKELLRYGGSEFISEYMGSVWKQVKQEELLGLILYVNSGKATKDYLEFLSGEKKVKKDEFLYKKFKSSFIDLVVKEANGEYVVQKREKNDKKGKVSPANYLDHGVIVDQEKKEIFIGFATSDYNTKSQQKQFFKKLKILQENFKTSEQFNDYKINPVYIANGLINEDQLRVGDKEHQKPFLNSFEKSLTGKEKNLINCASVISIMGNLSSTDRLYGLKIEDFLEITPYVSGSKTEWLKSEFLKLRKNKNSFLLRNFLINTATELLSVFEKIPDGNMKMLDSHAKVLGHCENIFKASVDGFNHLNMSKDTLLNKDFIEKVLTFSRKYEDIHIRKFMGAMPNSNELLAMGIYSVFSSEKVIKEMLSKNFERVEDLHNKKRTLKMIEKNEISDISSYQKTKIKQIASIIHENIPLALTKERFQTVLEEMKVMSKKFSNRDIKVLLRSDYVSTESHNFMKNFRKWEKKEDSQNKVDVSNIIFENIGNLDVMYEKIKCFKESTKERKTNIRI